MVGDRGMGEVQKLVGMYVNRISAIRYGDAHASILGKHELLDHAACWWCYRSTA